MKDRIVGIIIDNILYLTIFLALFIWGTLYLQVILDAIKSFAMPY